MKRIAIILCTLLVAALQLSAQIKTRNSRDNISINGIMFGYIYSIEQLKDALGIMFGYIYSIEQLKDALGEPSQINTHPADDYGYNHYIRFSRDLVVQMMDDPRENDPGIIAFILKSPKDSFEKVKNMPGYTSREKRYNGFYSIIFNNLMNDHSLQILFSQDEVIERISVAPRYY